MDRDQRAGRLGLVDRGRLPHAPLSRAPRGRDAAPDRAHGSALKLAETLQVEGYAIRAGHESIPGRRQPARPRAADELRARPDAGVRLRGGGVTLKKTVAAIHGENTTVVLYEILEAPAAISLELRPLVAYRDYHALQHANDALRIANASFKDGVFRATPYDGAPELLLQAEHATFTAQPDWYYRFEYREELARGLPAHEDLFCHGVFRRELARASGSA